MNYIHNIVDMDYREDYTPPPQEVTNGQCVLTDHGKKYFDELVKENKGKKHKTEKHEAETCFPPKEWSSENVSGLVSGVAFEPASSFVHMSGPVSGINF